MRIHYYFSDRCNPNGYVLEMPSYGLYHYSILQNTKIDLVILKKEDLNQLASQFSIPENTFVKIGNFTLFWGMTAAKECDVTTFLINFFISRCHAILTNENSTS